MNIKQLIKGYKRRIKSINSLLEYETSKLEKLKLETKRAVLRTFIHELQKCESQETSTLGNSRHIFEVMRSKNFDIKKCKIVGNRLLMYEQDLPEMTEQKYNIWFESSELVDGVRMGKIFIRDD